jgi:hypothetical protein
VLTIDLTNCDPRLKSGWFTMTDPNDLKTTRVDFNAGSTTEGGAVLANALCQIGINMLNKT